MKTDRIIFFDLMRAFAVFMMVQGHTIDAMLANEYRSFDSVFYSFWYTMRGFTAPIFMFTAGAVFTYLLNLNKLPFAQNPRVKKGVKRFAVLLFIGYLLRYPTYKIFDFSNVTSEQWKVFFAVDALHLIAFGLLFIIMFFYAAEKLQVNKKLLLSIGAAFFILFAIITKGIDWAEFLPMFLAAYFTADYGSLFPVFPIACYVVAGGILGLYLSENKGIFRNSKFVFGLSSVGIILVLLSFLISYSGENIFNDSSKIAAMPSLVFYRIGIVLLLNSAVAFISLKIKTIPELVKVAGRHTLLIYVLHLIIIYGSAWSPGLNKFYGRSFNPVEAISAAIFLIVLMTIIVWAVNNITVKKRNKKLATVKI